MVEGIIRESISKSYTKTLRKDGYLIANIYGGGRDNIACAFKANDFFKALKNKSSLIFDVKVQDKIYPVVIEEYQRHPVKSSFLHVDLLFVDENKVSNFKVPIFTHGQAIGVKNKGILIHYKKRLTIRCKPKDLIEKIEVDVSNLDVGHSIFVRDLKIANTIEKPNALIVGVLKAK